MNMKKMLFMTLAFVFTFCLGLSKVYATEISVDDGNKIAMPVLLYNDSDEQLTLKGLDGATLYYQIVDVTNEEEIRSQIDEYVVNSYEGLFEANETLKNTSQDNSTEYANNKTNVIFYETEILSGMKKANLKTGDKIVGINDQVVSSIAIVAQEEDIITDAETTTDNTQESSEVNNESPENAE